MILFWRSIRRLTSRLRATIGLGKGGGTVATKRSAILVVIAAALLLAASSAGASPPSAPRPAPAIGWERATGTG